MLPIRSLLTGFLPGECQFNGNRQFAEQRFRSLYGKDPGFIEAAAYDTLTMLVQTAMEPGCKFKKSI